jgi:hypothetical protein
MRKLLTSACPVTPPSLVGEGEAEGPGVNFDLNGLSLGDTSQTVVPHRSFSGLLDELRVRDDEPPDGFIENLFVAESQPAVLLGLESF